MTKLMAATVTLLTFMATAAHAELVNDFNCHLNEGYTVPKLYAFQQEWMAAARKHGFDEASYKTRVYFPMYAEVTDTKPMFFVWRGHFNNGATWGKMADWFPSSEWANKFNEVMNCGKASLWIAPQ
jgi:hypothetical protein